MACIEAQLGALAKREQAARQRRLAFDSDERLGSDQVARRAEQGMPALDGPHLDPIDPFDRAAKQCRVDDLDARAVGPKALVADDQLQSDRIDPEDQRPLLGNHVKKTFDGVGVDRGEDRLVNGRHRSRVTACEGDKVLVRLLDGAEPVAQPRHRALFEGDHRRHRSKRIRLERLISY